MARPIVEIQADLDAAYAARRSLLTSGSQSVSLGGQSITSVSLGELQEMIGQLEDELARATAAEDTDDRGSAAGFICHRLVRG
jgi:hypothetical protein